MSEKKQKVYPKGIAVFTKHEKAPEWVKETIIITPAVFFEWCKNEGNQYMSDYKGNDQIKLQLIEYEGKPSISVDTYKKEKTDDLPY